MEGYKISLEDANKMVKAFAKEFSIKDDEILAGGIIEPSSFFEASLNNNGGTMAWFGYNKNEFYLYFEKNFSYDPYNLPKYPMSTFYPGQIGRLESQE